MYNELDATEKILVEKSKLDAPYLVAMMNRATHSTVGRTVK